MTNTLNQIFFLHQNQNIFFSNIGNQNIFLEKNHNPPPPFKLNRRSLMQINQHLQNTDWDIKFGDSDNVIIINEVINLELNSAMNTYIPKKIIRVRPQDKPWINSEIKCKIRKRNRVHKISKSSK